MSGDAVCGVDVVTGCEVVPTHSQFCRIETEGQEARNGYGAACFIQALSLGSCCYNACLSTFFNLV